jgi:hypothetical protein
MKKNGARNYPHHEADIAIRDIRGREPDFALDIHGSKAISDVSIDALNFLNCEEIEAIYIPKIKELLLKHVKDSCNVVVFDTTIRRASKSEPIFRRAIV